MLNLDATAAVIAQQIAARRHLWAQQSMDEAEYYLHTPNGTAIISEFNLWSKERAEYAKNAMMQMSLTEGDQFYA